MSIAYVGVITGGAQSQHFVNEDHARDIGRVLSNKYKVHYYDLSVPGDLEQLIQDRRNGQLDIIFNNAAGKKGGDGTVEGLLEILGIPFVGSDTLATAVAFDKKTTKAVVADAGVPIIRGLNISEEEFLDNQKEVVQKIEEELKYPVVVKASQGSDSIGISLVKKPADILPALMLAFKEDQTVIVEDFIRRSLEVTCMVIGNGKHAEAFTPVERVYETELLYARDLTERDYRIPDCDPQILEAVKRYSILAHNALGCADYSRSDFLINRKNEIYFLELNGHAGLGQGGPTEYSAKTSKNWDYSTLIHSLLKIALDRYGAPHLQ